MNVQNTSLVREAVVEKLAQVPDESIRTVLTFLETLIAQRENGPKSKLVEENEKELCPPEEVTTWDQWFEEIKDLSEIPELANLTKQGQREVITQGLVEEYNKQSSDIAQKES